MLVADSLWPNPHAAQPNSTTPQNNDTLCIHFHFLCRFSFDWHWLKCHLAKCYFVYPKQKRGYRYRGPQKMSIAYRDRIWCFFFGFDVIVPVHWKDRRLHSEYLKEKFRENRITCGMKCNENDFLGVVPWERTIEWCIFDACFIFSSYIFSS